MPKTILIFADGTGQIGGISPDQRLSNIYKMYRAMRPGPDSPIDPKDQVAFYDPGLGSAETRVFSRHFVRKLFEGALGFGLDENVIDCYSAIIAHYDPGDLVCLFGFSRGAYTVRAVANVMNLCGVPTRCPQNKPVPRYGPRLHAIAEEAVRKIYNHGAGWPKQLFEEERETLASRFREKYGSNGTGADGEGQGNVQPYFIGVFDTVAALRSRTAAAVVLATLAAIGWATIWAVSNAPWWIWLPIAALDLGLLWRFIVDYFPIHFFVPDAFVALPKWHPRRLFEGLWYSHLAWWTGKDYDKYVDREIPYLRHARSIDEDRKRFPVVGWGSGNDVQWNESRGKMDWLKQCWFAGNHSDVGGSYPEDQSRLSDIALEWMTGELSTSLGDRIIILRDRLNIWPDPLGLQHDERVSVLDSQPAWLKFLTFSKLTWMKETRSLRKDAPLHSSVLHRLAASSVPQMGNVAPYRPEALKEHELAAKYFP